MCEQCPDPPACSAGQYSIGNGKNGGGDYACSGSLCAAGKYGQTGATSSAAATCSGSLCAAGKYGQTGATSSAAATCAPCPVGTYSETEGLSLQSTRSLAPGHLFESLHHSVRREQDPVKHTCIQTINSFLARSLSIQTYIHKYI